MLADFGYLVVYTIIVWAIFAAIGELYDAFLDWRDKREKGDK